VIFLTVGSAFPFDRLVVAVDELVGRGLVREEVFAQIGVGGARPKHMRCEEVLDKPRFDALVREASALVGHAGMGTITAALEHKKPLVVLPRRKEHGELVNDHQLATARRFEADGMVLAAYEVGQLAEKIAALATFVPRQRVAQPEAVARRVGEFLAGL
jgi:beta-1,4-N-acetylglucosaminyltransferase